MSLNMARRNGQEVEGVTPPTDTTPIHALARMLGNTVHTAIDLLVRADAEGYPKTDNNTDYLTPEGVVVNRFSFDPNAGKSGKKLTGKTEDKVRLNHLGKMIETPYDFVLISRKISGPLKSGFGLKKQVPDEEIHATFHTSEARSDLLAQFDFASRVPDVSTFYVQGRPAKISATPRMVEGREEYRTIGSFSKKTADQLYQVNDAIGALLIAATGELTPIMTDAELQRRDPGDQLRDPHRRVPNGWQRAFKSAAEFLS